jgi:hypothetical protein
VLPSCNQSNVWTSLADGSECAEVVYCRSVTSWREIGALSPMPPCRRGN